MSDTTEHLREHIWLNRITWIILCSVAALTFLSYSGISLAASGGELLLPLDDTYIHFQYARQMADGQPFNYNMDAPPTSGATSLIYPVVLAVGYIIGFDGLSLGLWALAVGALALLAAGWLVMRVVRLNGPGLVALVFALAFMLNGSVAWHYMSGMETGLVITLTLWTFYALLAGRFRQFVIAATFLAVARPEGSIMTVIAVLVVALQSRLAKERPTYNPLWLIIPLCAVLLQPGLNLTITGSVSSTGGQAKFILNVVPFYSDVVIERIVVQFVQMWTEFVTDTLYLPLGVVPLALIGVLALFLHNRWLGLVVVGWFLAVSGAIATLDTAFWHFKRYQMPLMALMFPLAAVGLLAISRWVWWQVIFTPHKLTSADRQRRSRALKRVQNAGAVLLVIALVFPAVLNAGEFLRLYRVNVVNVAVQPLPMAQWLRQNTPDDALIAVHDVGMMRYYGQRDTLDMVGLTTEGAADYWRNGPGAVGEFLIAHEPQPDYVAAYTTARGLNYLVDTPIYGLQLAGFTADYNPADNVALGAEFQGVFQPDFSCAGAIRDTLRLEYPGMELVSTLNVAHLTDEARFNYSWYDEERITGFSTEFFALDYGDGSTICDGGRRINGEEIFTVQAEPGRDAFLVTRVHSAHAGSIDIRLDAVYYVDTLWIPYRPGQWFDLVALIPGEFITSEQTDIHIQANTPGGHYMPYYHWWLQGEYLPTERDALVSIRETQQASPVLATYQLEAFHLSVIRQDYDPEGQRLNITLGAEANDQTFGDYKAFIHLYDDPAAEPIAQADGYLSGLPGNWLPGAVVQDYDIDLTGIQPGVYEIAIGFYNPYTFERLTPSSTSDMVRVDADDNRLFIGEIRVVPPS